MRKNFIQVNFKRFTHTEWQGIIEEKPSLFSYRLNFFRVETFLLDLVEYVELSNSGHTQSFQQSNKSVCTWFYDFLIFRT